MLAGIALGIGVAAPAPIDAQQFRFGATRVQLGDGLPDIPGGFTFCRLAYLRVRREASGSGWTTDDPDAERNLTTRLSELTPMTPSRWSHGKPGFAVVTATDPELFQCPFLFRSDAGTMGLDEAEALALGSLRSPRSGTGAPPPGGTAERGAESAEPRLRAIMDEDGRILVLMSHNTDIADGWEREVEVGARFPPCDAGAPPRSLTRRQSFG